MLLKPIKTALNVMVTRKRLYSESWHFLVLAGLPYKYNQCHTTLGRLSGVCAKLEPANSKNNEMLEINVLQKFTSHALYTACPLQTIMKNIRSATGGKANFNGDCCAEVKTMN